MVEVKKKNYRYKTGTWVYFEGFTPSREESHGKHWGMIVAYGTEVLNRPCAPCYTVVEILDDGEFGNEFYYGVRDEDIDEAFTTDIVQGLKFAVKENRPYVNLVVSRELSLMAVDYSSYDKGSVL